MGSPGDAAMSDLEFQRELSPEQIREALSLLDSKTGAQNHNLRVEDQSPPEEVDLEVDQSSTITASQDRPPAAEDTQPRKRYLTLAVAFYGLGIAAIGALVLLSWSEGTLIPAPMPGAAHEDQPAKSPPPALPVVNPPPDQSPVGSERRPSKPEVARLSPVGYPNHDDNQAAIREAANSANTIPHAAQTATVTPIAESQAWQDERASRKSKEALWHARAVRVAAAKKRFWRRHWQARTEIKCFFFVCFSWQTQRAFYEPPGNVTQ